MMMAASTIAPMAMAMPPKRHDVGGEVEIIHRDEREMMAIGSVIMATSALRHMEKKNDDDGTDNKALLDQFFFQSGDRFQDKIRTVIGGDDLYAWREEKARSL